MSTCHNCDCAPPPSPYYSPTTPPSPNYSATSANYSTLKIEKYEPKPWWVRVVPDDIEAKTLAYPSSSSSQGFVSAGDKPLNRPFVAPRKFSSFNPGVGSLDRLKEPPRNPKYTQEDLQCMTFEPGYPRLCDVETKEERRLRLLDDDYVIVKAPRKKTPQKKAEKKKKKYNRKADTTRRFGQRKRR